MKKIVRFQIISFIVVCIVGTLLHFTFEWSGNNHIVAAFSSTNESTWEHLKLVFYPMLIMTVIGYFYLGKDVKNYLCAKTLGIIYAISFIVIFFYTYTGILGTNLAIFDISSFFIAGFLSYYYSYKKIVTKKYRSNCTLFSILSIVILFGSFILFTLVPPKIGIFNDPITNTYGIFKIK